MYYYIIKLFSNRTTEIEGDYMSNNTFFKPTALYKEFMILDLIEKNKHITQREMSKQIGAAVSMVNGYIKDKTEFQCYNKNEQ